MNSDEASDTTPLLAGNEEEQGDAVSDGTGESQRTEKINLKGSVLVILGTFMGTGVLISSFSVLQLGAVAWIAILLFAGVCMFMCSHLMSVSVQHMISVNGVDAVLRDPYPAVAELSGGTKLRRVIITLLYVDKMLIVAALMLLSATILKGIIPINGISNTNTIRLWVTIITVLITPVMYLGDFSELIIPSLIAVSMTLVSLVAILINCFLARYLYGVNPGERVIVHVPPKEPFLIPLGSTIFTVGAIANCVPNILVLATKPTKLSVSLFSSVGTTLVVLLISGLVPYVLLGNNVLPSISLTFEEISKVKDTGTLFKVLTFAIQFLMTIHMSMANVLTINPVYLHMEEVLNIPREICWQRLAIRTSFMLIIFGICMGIPTFQAIISLSGAVPVIILGITCPLVIYHFVFELGLKTKICIWFFVILSLVFIICYVVLRAIHLST